MQHKEERIKTIEQIVEAHPHLDCDSIYTVLSFATEALKFDVDYPVSEEYSIAEEKLEVTTTEKEPLSPTLVGRGISSLGSSFESSYMKYFTENVLDTVGNRSEWVS